MILFYDLVKVLLLRKAPHISRFSAEMFLYLKVSQLWQKIKQSTAEKSLLQKPFWGVVWEKPICINKRTGKKLLLLKWVFSRCINYDGASNETFLVFSNHCTVSLRLFLIVMTPIFLQPLFLRWKNYRPPSLLYFWTNTELTLWQNV